MDVENHSTRFVSLRYTTKYYFLNTKIMFQKLMPPTLPSSLPKHGCFCIQYSVLAYIKSNYPTEIIPRLHRSWRSYIDSLNFIPITETRYPNFETADFGNFKTINHLDNPNESFVHARLRMQQLPYCLFSETQHFSNLQ